MKIGRGASACRAWKSVLSPLPRQLAATSDGATAPPGVVPGPVTMKTPGAEPRAAAVVVRDVASFRP